MSALFWFLMSRGHKTNSTSTIDACSFSSDAKGRMDVDTGQAINRDVTATQVRIKAHGQGCVGQGSAAPAWCLHALQRKRNSLSRAAKKLLSAAINSQLVLKPAIEQNPYKLLKWLYAFWKGDFNSRYLQLTGYIQCMLPSLSTHSPVLCSD